MKLMPDPLHPAIVHFPIVLILLGAAVAVVAAFWRKHPLPLLAAILLVLGAVGAYVAVQTGQSEGGLVESTSPQVDSLLDTHQDWAKRTLAMAAGAAVAALISLGLSRSARLARLAAVVTALAALAASYGVVQTGHRGGALVYQHGTGVKTAGAPAASPAPAATDPD